MIKSETSTKLIIISKIVFLMKATNGNISKEKEYSFQAPQKKEDIYVE